ncbi:MAG: DUF58 domain-containing protein [Spirochaetes bacterium]|nr:MAG: DUF58 domain-containing protein [Spirochaetota bacterium]
MERDKLFSQVKKIQLITSKMVHSLFAGNYRSVFRGPGIEFDEVREYAQDDDIRLIDWNVTSRTGFPHTKVFKEERELTLFLIVDVSASLFFGSGERSKRDTAAIIAAVLSLAAVSNNDKAGALFFTEKIEHWIPPDKGKKHILRLIRDMLDCNPAGRGSDLALALRTVNKSLKRRGICVILSDFKTTSGLRELTLLKRKHDVIAVKITDRMDFVYPETGLVELEDPETYKKIFGFGYSKKFRLNYRDYWDNIHQQWLKEIKSRGVDVIVIDTEDDPARKLLAFFKHRKRR